MVQLPIGIRVGSVVSLLMVLTITAGCSRSTSKSDSESDPSLIVVTLQLNWFPEHEHGGFFAALLHGHYEQEGLDVQILPGGPKVAVANQLVTRRAHFAVANADEVLLARAQNANLVALMAPLDQSPRCIMVHADSGIDSFDELAGSTLALKVGSPFAEFLQRRGYLRDVEIVPYFGGIGRFVTNPRYAQQAYSFSEPVLAKREGTHPKSLMLSDLGFNPYAGVLVTLDTTLASQQEVAERFVAASLRGWRQYLADPETTNRHLATLNKSLDAEMLAAGVEILRPLCREPTDEKFGRMSPERWEELATQLVELKLVAADKVDSKAAFTNELVEQADD